MGLGFDAIIPALNEENTVAGVVEVLISSGRFDNVIVVDNGSVDNTASKAAAAGATVVSCPTRGLGFAVKAGIRQSSAARILRTDADIDNWDVKWLDTLCSVNADFVRAIFESPYDDFPTNRLVAQPLLALLRPSFDVVPLPLTGTYIFDRHAIELDCLGDDWSFDISLVCEMQSRERSISNVNIGVLSDRKRPIDHYVPMATEIIKYMLRREVAGPWQW